ncbi:telomere repeat-binding factor 5 isoform X2 [Eutrema salsugineum]|uniref:telomere repeat-binding factor 5 isoform X2 n=1 Tax=Eutrema salsugineum TaxID=72664 RepID=UPI000CED1E27|nr:telomere repeat-binding factor 5 isoform X2 [Eutrema salsugineum]
MGNQKLKWTAEEEEALLAGIAKHGAGKWKNILRDPEFADQLTNRSNIDLKDKWRNLSVSPGTQCSKDKARPTKVKDEAVTPAAVAVTTTPPPNDNSSPSPATSLRRSASTEFSIDNSCNIVVDTKNAPRYDGMIFEALSSLVDANGSDVGSIFSFIEPRHEVPPNFRRVLSSRLRRLAAQGKLVKVSNLKPLQNFYKLPDRPGATRTPALKLKETTNIKPRQSNNQAPAVSQEMIEEAAITAACKVVEAENKIGVAKVAVEDLEKMTKLAEETEILLELAKEIHEQCCRGELVLLA